MTSLKRSAIDVVVKWKASTKLIAFAHPKRILCTIFKNGPQVILTPQIIQKHIPSRKPTLPNLLDCYDIVCRDSLKFFIFDTNLISLLLLIRGRSKITSHLRGGGVVRINDYHFYSDEISNVDIGYYLSEAEKKR